jgi:hypothetical protein
LGAHTPPILARFQCFGALRRFKCFFGPRGLVYYRERERERREWGMGE